MLSVTKLDPAIIARQFALRHPAFVTLGLHEHHPDRETDVELGLQLLQKIWLDGYYHPKGKYHKYLDFEQIRRYNYKIITFRSGFFFAS